MRKTHRESARIPPFGLPESDLLILTLASQLRCLAHPFIGTVRANPVAAPAAPLDSVWDIFIFQIFFIGIDKSFPLKLPPLTKIE